MLDFYVPYLVADVMKIFTHLSRNSGTHIGRIQERYSDRKWFTMPLINDLNRCFGFYIIRNRNNTWPHNICTIDYIGYCARIHHDPAVWKRELNGTLKCREYPVARIHQEWFFVNHEQRNIGVGLKYFNHIRMKKFC